jgi:hypothetical protein
MLIVNHENRRAALRQDPLVRVGSDQFRKGIDKLKSLLDSSNADGDDVFELCDSLCEASRELLFRLHRVTESELKSIVSLFENAASQVSQAIDRCLVGTSWEADARGYHKHIQGRVDLLKKYLE